MAQPLRGLRWRAAVTIAGAAFALMYLFASGRGPGYLIQIDYTWASEFLDSADVEIDGEVAGILKRYGRSQLITGFEVEAGEHVVRVLKEGCESKPDTVRLSATEGRLAVLIADVDDGFRCRVLLR